MMTTRIAKVQYKNFEAGEFVDARERSYEETVEMIKGFPWNAQREQIVIELTNPSVTIEGKNNDFLKLMPYYHQKYALHYFNEEQALFTKSFVHLDEVFPFVKMFFEQPRFEPAGFRKQTTWFQSNLKHFATSDFRYCLTRESVRKYLWATSGINFLFSAGMLPLVVKSLFGMYIPPLIIILILMFVMGGGVNLLFFFNLYKNAKGKILVMSKGNDIFYFGELDNPVKYSKKDLSEFIITKFSGSRNPYGGFAVSTLKMKDGTVLTVPNILVDHSALADKLFEFKPIFDGGLPLV